MDLGGPIRRRRKSAAKAAAKAGAKATAKKTRRPAGPATRKKRPQVKRAVVRRTAAGPVRVGRFAVHPGLAAFVVAAVGLGLGYLVAVTLIFPAPETPVELQGVPDLRGQPLALALSELADSGLAVSRVDSVRHPLVAAGTVIGQSPLPGLTALLHAPVRVTVSSGREVRPVPDLTRLGGNRAAELLEAGGFLVQVDTVESTVAADRVLRIEPAPGTEVALPGRVRLMVSRGPPTFLMPDLAGMTQGEAFALLRAMGMVLGEVDRRYSLLNVRLVFGQYPEPYEPVVEGTNVRLVLGREVPWQ